ncbi:MAG: TetR/AcrR family transcriptional regulator, partial [Myxococcales bacterium]|nr:TetR/AcrR family transcriptional regulator [Myxococcales bacterium]
FATQGFAGTGIDAVCRQAGVAKTALYWHFGSKEGLIAAVVEEAGNQFIEQLQKRVYLEGDPIQRIDRLIEGWRVILSESPELVRLPMMVQLEHGAKQDEPIGAAVRRVLERAEAALVEGIEDSLGAVVAQPERVAQTIVALLQGAAVRQGMQPDAGLDGFFEEVRRTIVLMIWSRLPESVRSELEQGARGDRPA